MGIPRADSSTDVRRGLGYGRNRLTAVGIPDQRDLVRRSRVMGG